MANPLGGPKKKASKDITHVMVELLSEVLKCCQSANVGADGALLALKQTHLTTKNGGKELSDFIIKTCCEEFDITRASLSRAASGKGSSKRLRGDRSQAMSFIYILHKSHMNMTREEISELFGHNYKNVWRHINDFENMSSANKVDLVILKRYNKVSDKVAEYVQSMKSV